MARWKKPATSAWNGDESNETEARNPAGKQRRWRPASMRAAAVAAVLAVGLLAFGPRAGAGVPMPVGGLVPPPAGFIGFCVFHTQACGGSARASVMPLTPQRWRQLEAVQSAVNESVKPRAEPRWAWHYPSDGFGDCNSYALAKRAALEAQGWPADALLLAAALTERGEGHLVLVARTSAGDFALDNRAARVVDWRALPYRWLARQNGADLTEWVRIEVGRG